MSENTDQTKAEELLQQSKTNKRHTSEPRSESTDDGTPALAEAVTDAYRRLDDGDLHENLSVRDADLSALVAALEASGRLEDVAARANDRLDRDGPTDTRAALLKALIRLGLRDVAADELDEWAEGKREFASSSADVM